MVRFDVPAVLDYVQRETGQSRVNWVGHSLGGMLIFPFLEQTTQPGRIANFVGMGSTIIQAGAPRYDMLMANAGIRTLLHLASAGRMGRPLTYYRPPGMASIDRFYYSAENVDPRTIARFYGYTLEDPGSGALRQFAPYLRYGHLLSADGRIDYSSRLGEVTVPTLMIAGAADLISDVPSTRMTFDALGSTDKTCTSSPRRMATSPITPIVIWHGAGMPRRKSSPWSSTGSIDASRGRARRPRSLHAAFPWWAYRARRKALMQICDQVSNSPAI